mmetsp:Transcript_39519/g.92858  ORF Transcript_39519/g.92858 Transcript_39519/m.92858 type:complete len:114 (+) Transcript_39519:105-446(+)
MHRDDRTMRDSVAQSAEAVMWGHCGRRSTLHGHRRPVSSVTFSPDGKLLASASWDKTVKLWSTETGAKLWSTLHGHRRPVSSVTFSPDGKLLASASWDKTVKLWSTETGAKLW